MKTFRALYLLKLRHNYRKIYIFILTIVPGDIKKKQMYVDKEGENRRYLLQSTFMSPTQEVTGWSFRAGHFI